MRTRPGFSGSLPATGWSSSSPKWRAKATCSARVMSWSRKKSTRCFSSRARISATSSGERDAMPRLTLLSWAPIAQVSGSTFIESGSAAARTTAGAKACDIWFIWWLPLLRCRPSVLIERRPSPHQHHERDGDECRFVFALDLDGVLGRHDHTASALVVDRQELYAVADALARAHRSQEPDFFEPVVEDLLRRGAGHQDAQRSGGHQREREIAMCNGSAERALAARALDVDVNPLGVAGAFGELADARLVERDPVRRAKFFPDARGKIGGGYEERMGHVHGEAFS